MLLLYILGAAAPFYSYIFLGKAKIDELETNSRNKNIRYLCRSIIDFEEGLPAWN